MAASVKQRDAVQDFYAGHTDADTVIKSIAQVLPTHERLSEYAERGSEAVERPGVTEGEHDINELIAEIARLNGENEKLEEFAEKKISEDELAQCLEDQSFLMGREKEEEITRLKAEYEIAKTQIAENFRKRFDALQQLVLFLAIRAVYHRPMRAHKTGLDA